MTDEEEDKLLQLQVEMFALDIVLPLILDLGGHKKLLKGKVSDAQFKTVTDAVKAALGSMPKAYESVKKGKYKEALEEFMLTMYTKWSSSQMKNFLEPFVTLVGAIADETATGGYFSQNIDEISGKIKKFNKFIKFLDNIMKASDYGRIAYSLANANSLESWDVTAKRNDLKLLPLEETTIRGKFVDFEVFGEPNPNSGAVLQYTWSTTGKYGVIRDNNINEGTSFTSSKDKVSYITNVSEDELGEGDNVDEVKVIVSVKQGNTITKIGEVVSTINVVKFKYKIKPDGITVSGGTSIGLSITRTDGETLKDNDVYESKVVWQTSGTYGKLNGINNTVTLQSRSSYNVNYEALDEEVESGTETITASIYRKQKTDNDWLLWDTAEATINIKNDKNVKYLYPKVEYEIWNDPSGDGYGYSVFFQFSPEENAKSYALTIKELKFGNNSTSFVGSGRSWTAGNDADLTDGSYRYSTYSGSGPNSARPDAVSALATLEGYAQVKVVLNP